MLDPSEPATRAIGLLGGSFNPPHDGHLEISQAALSLLPIDSVWWLVSPGNPLKAPEDYGAYDARCAAARALTQGAAIEISDFERQENLVYTVDTLALLRERYPANQFVWLMGADSLYTFHLWEEWRRIADLTPIAIFNRPGYEDAPTESIAGKALSEYRIDERRGAELLEARPPVWAFFSHTANPASSTALRETMTQSTE